MRSNGPPARKWIALDVALSLIEVLLLTAPRESVLELILIFSNGWSSAPPMRPNGSAPRKSRCSSLPGTAHFSMSNIAPRKITLGFVMHKADNMQLQCGLGLPLLVCLLICSALFMLSTSLRIYSSSYASDVYLSALCADSSIQLHREVQQVSKNTLDNQVACLHCCSQLRHRLLHHLVSQLPMHHSCID